MAHLQTQFPYQISFPVQQVLSPNPCTTNHILKKNRFSANPQRDRSFRARENFKRNNPSKSEHPKPSWPRCQSSSCILSIGPLGGADQESRPRSETHRSGSNINSSNTARTESNPHRRNHQGTLLHYELH